MVLHRSIRWRAMSSSVRKSLLDTSTDRNAKLVCGKCEHDLAGTNDLFFLHWQRGTHVASFQNAVLEHLTTSIHPLSHTQPWKKAKLNCSVCDNGVATRATVRGQDITLFSAKHVSFRLPLGSSPIVSISGLPSDILRFSTWSDLMAQVAATPTLQAALKIRHDKERIQRSTTDHRAINTKILLAESGIDVLQIVDNERHLNHVNILTAFQRFAMFHQRTLDEIAKLKRRQTSHTLIHVDDDAIAAQTALYKTQLQKLHHDMNLIYTTRFWNLVSEMERHCQMQMHVVPSRYLFMLLKSMVSLHVAPSNLAENLAKQIEHRVPQNRFSIEKLVHFLHGFAILCSGDKNGQQWMASLFTIVCDYLLQHDVSPELLGMAAWSCVVAKIEHHEIFERLLKNTRKIRPNNTLATQIYQVCLACEMNQFRIEHLIDSSRREMYKNALIQQQEKNISSRLHSIVSETLKEMKIPHENEYIMELGYSIDIALVDERIGIEVNGPSHYQLRYNPSERILLGGTILKLRHLKYSKWTILQISYEDISKLSKGKSRQDYLSLLLEIAMASRINI